MASCITVEAQKADYQNCTKKIPVRVGNKTRFADPFTYILTNFPTVLPCSDLTPVRWYIASKWYCATPKTQECREPEKLNLTDGESPSIRTSPWATLQRGWGRKSTPNPRRSSTWR